MAGLLLLLWSEGHSQQNTTVFGIHLKPMVPNKFFGAGPQVNTEEGLQATFAPKFGLNFGMVVRKGFGKMWSFETGINIVQRNYDVDFSHPALLHDKSMSFRYICYEIPLQAMVFVKLGEHLYMNASGGVSLDMYPSNVESSTSDRNDTIVFDFYQKTYRNGWLQFALLANYGFEWRTKDKGYFYIGASYHRPFREIGFTRVTFVQDTDPTRLEFYLKGNYLTADLRYFFHEKAERKKPKSFNSE